MPDVVITRDPRDIEAAIQGALSHLDLEALLGGRLVAIKSNDTYASEDDTTGVT